MRSAATLSFLLWLMLVVTASAQWGWPVPEPADWQTRRNAQPAGLGLTLELPKTRYKLGEPIIATVKGVNATGQVFEVVYGAVSEPSRRIIHFAPRVVDATGTLRPDPLKGYLGRGNIYYRWSSRGEREDLSGFAREFEVNRYSSITQPGEYELYIEYVDPPADTIPSPSASQLSLVSDKVRVIIEPFAATAEEQSREVLLWLNAPRATPAQGDESRERYIRYLGYLQTEWAQGELIKMLATDDAYQAKFVLYAQPDPATVAERTRLAVKEKRLMPTSEVLSTYEILATAWENAMDARLAARKVILNAVHSATHGEGEAHIEALLYRYQVGDETEKAKAREDLMGWQFELSEKQKILLLNSQLSKDAAFLPFMRREAGEPVYSNHAFNVLNRHWPDEAQAMVVAEVKRAHEYPAQFRQYNNGPMNLLKLPQEPIAALQEWFRAELGNPQKEWYYLLQAVEMYGDETLLPQVKQVYAERHQYPRHPIDNSTSVGGLTMRFWLRMDRAGAILALEQQFAASSLEERREVLGHFGHRYWVEEALPLVEKALDDPDAFLNRSALYLLSDHGSQRHLEPAIARLETLQFPPDEKNVKHRMSSLAGELLYSRQWEVSPEQESRLRRYYIPYYENQ